MRSSPGSSQHRQAVADEPVGQRFFICCDGTWQDGINTKRPLSNVAQLARYISPVSEDGFRQIVYYDSGVGNTNAVFAPAVDGATGRGISAKIRNAYSFLSHNYTFVTEENPEYPGTDSERLISKSQRDEIVLVGFSRGAFTVQCLASLLSSIGLLHKDSLQYLRDLFVLWANQDLPNRGEWTIENWKVNQLPNMVAAGEIRRQEVVEIKALAVWDTVSSLGIIPARLSPRPLAFVEGQLPESVQNAFHALALNESRAVFSPCVWSDSQEQAARNIKQCWFLGSHTDIGGGNEDSGLAIISFVWMVSQLKSLGVAFDAIDPTELHFVNHPELNIKARRLRGTIDGKEEVNSKITTLGNLNQAGRYWYVLGLRRRGKRLQPKILETDDGEGTSDTGQDTHDQAAELNASSQPQQKGVRRKFESKGKDPVRLPVAQQGPDGEKTSTFIHFSVRIMMGKRRNTCHVLRKWKTREANERVIWERATKQRRGSKEVILRLFEDAVDQEEWHMWRRPSSDTSTRRCALQGEGESTQLKTTGKVRRRSTWTGRRRAKKKRNASGANRATLGNFAVWRKPHPDSGLNKVANAEFLLGAPPSSLSPHPRQEVTYTAPSKLNVHE